MTIGPLGSPPPTPPQQRIESNGGFIPSRALPPSPSETAPLGPPEPPPEEVIPLNTQVITQALSDTYRGEQQSDFMGFLKALNQNNSLPEQTKETVTKAMVSFTEVQALFTSEGSFDSSNNDQLTTMIQKSLEGIVALCELLEPIGGQNYAPIKDKAQRCLLGLEEPSKKMGMLDYVRQKMVSGEHYFYGDSNAQSLTAVSLFFGDIDDLVSNAMEGITSSARTPPSEEAPRVEAPPTERIDINLNEADVASMIHGGKMSKAHAQQFYSFYGLSKEQMQELIQNEEARAIDLLERCQSTQELEPIFKYVDQGYLSATKWIQKMDELSPNPRHQSTYESLQATARASSGAAVQANSSEGIGNIGNTCYFNSATQLLRALPIGKFGSAYDYLCQISGDSITHGGTAYPLPEATKGIRDNTLEAWKTLLHPTQTSSEHNASVEAILNQFPGMFPIPTQGDPGELITFAFMQVFVPDASVFESESGIDPKAHDFGYAIESSTVDVLNEDGEVMASTTKQTPVWMSAARASESVDECLPEILSESERLKEIDGSSLLHGHPVDSLTQRKTVTIRRGTTNNITLKDVKRTSFNRRTNSCDRDTAHQNFNMDSLEAVIFHSGTATGGHYTSLRKVGEDKYLKISDSTVEELTRDQAIVYLTHHGHQIKMILQNNHAAHALEPSGESPPSGASAPVGDALPGSVPDPGDRRQQQAQRQLGVARQAFRSEVDHQLAQEKQLAFKPERAATSIYANAEKTRLSTTGDGNCAFNGIALGLLNVCSVEQLNKLTCDRSILCKDPQRWVSVPDPITGEWLKTQFQELTKSDGPDPALKLRRLQQSLAPELRAWSAIAVKEQWDEIKAQLTTVMLVTIEKLAEGIKLDDYDNDYLKWFGEGMMELSDIIRLKTPQQRQAAFSAWIEGPGKIAYLAALRTDGFNADSIALQALATHLSPKMGTKVLVSSTADVGVPPEFRWHENLLSILETLDLTPEERTQISNLYSVNLSNPELSSLAYKTDEELHSLTTQSPINIAVWHSGGHWTYDLANSTNVVVSE